MANTYVCGVCGGSERVDADGNVNHSCPGPPPPKPAPKEKGNT